MKVSAFDPSSTAIGYACGTSSSVAVSMELIKPRGKGKEWFEKFNSTEGAVRRVLADDKPDVIVIENISGLEFGRAKRKGSLQPYAATVGAVYCLCRLYARKLGRDPNTAVVMIKPQLWTKGCSKLMRQMIAREDFHRYGYRYKDDPGYDVADALCLMQWYFNHRA